LGLRSEAAIGRQGSAEFSTKIAAEVDVNSVKRQNWNKEFNKINSLFVGIYFAYFLQTGNRPHKSAERN